MEDGDTIVVLGHVDAKGRESRGEAKLPFVHIARFRDGKIERFQVLTDTVLTAEALGKL